MSQLSADEYRRLLEQADEPLGPLVQAALDQTIANMRAAFPNGVKLPARLKLKDRP